MALLHNPHPGEILKAEFLDEAGLSQNQIARAIGVPPNRIHAIVAGTRGITADTDLRLCRYFGLSEGWWLRGQASYDTAIARAMMPSATPETMPDGLIRHKSA
jgi:addiction module HigA family antidote